MPAGLQAFLSQVPLEVAQHASATPNDEPFIMASNASPCRLVIGYQILTDRVDISLMER